MDVQNEVERVRQNIRNLERKLFMVEMSVQEALLRMEKYKVMSMRVSEKIQNIKWKIFKADFVQRYEKARHRRYLEKLQRSGIFKIKPNVSRSSKGKLEEYLQLRKSLSDKLESLEKKSNEKEQQVCNLEREVQKLREENAALMNRLTMDLEKKEEEERRLEEELEQIKAEEEKINLAIN